MSAMYQMTYQGGAGSGHGAITMGNGRIVGVDVTGAQYHGNYSQGPNGLSGTVQLTSSGAQLVTGQSVPAGTQIGIIFNNLPLDMGNGKPVQVTVGGNPVMVAFSKIGEI